MDFLNESKNKSSYRPENAFFSHFLFFTLLHFRNGFIYYDEYSVVHTYMFKCIALKNFNSQKLLFLPNYMFRVYSLNSHVS